MNNKKICIIYTGGTIGMVSTENGFAPCKGNLQRVMDSIPDFKDDSLPSWDIIEFDELLDSSNVGIAEWNQIGRLISDNYSDYDGFVVLHGTDTMAYTASALSFMLENLAKPVILTGSQIPLCLIRSDGRDNLLSSLMIAADGKVSEVCICFGSKLLRGNRATKKSADELNAFASYNCPLLATMGITINYNDDVIEKTITKKPFNFVEFKDTSISVIKIFPGIHPGIYQFTAKDHFKGVILETFGAGNIPNDENLLSVIRDASENDTIFVVCSQCMSGKVSLGGYEAGNIFKEAGAVSGYDMTTECAIAKLYYLYSKGYTTATIKEMLEIPLRRELTY